MDGAGHRQPAVTIGERLVGELALAYLEHEARDARDGIVKPSIRAAIRRLTGRYSLIPSVTSRCARPAYRLSRPRMTHSSLAHDGILTDVCGTTTSDATLVYCPADY